MPHLLIVDDEPSVLISLTEAVRYRLSEVIVETASSSEAALRAMESKAFQVVLSDIRMPGMNGVQLLREIKSRWPETKVFLMTGAENQWKAEALKAGASGFFEKPLDVGEIVRQLQEALQARLERQIRIRRDKPRGEGEGPDTSR